IGWAPTPRYSAPHPKTEGGAGGERRGRGPPAPFFGGGRGGGDAGTWGGGTIRPGAPAGLGGRYRRCRPAHPPRGGAMAGSLRRWGQLAPVVACAHGAQLELLEGFKRLAAAQQVAGWTTLSVRVVDVDEPAAKAAILGLNRSQRPVRELEEAWIVQAL